MLPPPFALALAALAVVLAAPVPIALTPPRGVVRSAVLSATLSLAAPRAVVVSAPPAVALAARPALILSVAPSPVGLVTLTAVIAVPPIVPPGFMVYGLGFGVWGLGIRF